MSWIVVFLEKFAEACVAIFQESKEIILDPAKNTSMLWTLIPLVAGMFVLEIYFGHYKKEKLGWNSAVSNSLMLFFVGMNLFSYLYSTGFSITVSQEAGLNLIGSEIATIKFFIGGFIVFEALLLFFVNFFHLIPKKFAFGVSSGLFMNFLACIGIILVYGSIPLTWMIVPGVLLIFVVLLLLLTVVEFIEPKSWREEDE